MSVHDLTSVHEFELASVQASSLSMSISIRMLFPCCNLAVLSVSSSVREEAKNSSLSRGM